MPDLLLVGILLLVTDADYRLDPVNHSTVYPTADCRVQSFLHEYLIIRMIISNIHIISVSNVQEICMVC